MDTHCIELPLLEHDASRRIVDAVLAGRDVTLAASADAQPLLDAVAQALAGRRCRTLQAFACASDGLSLSGLMAQIAQQPSQAAQDGKTWDGGASDDEVLERGSKALTDLDDGCDCIVLLVNGAAAMQPSALRYLQFACRTSPSLRLVLAGADGLSSLTGTELSALRTRLAGALTVAVAAAGTAPMPESRDYDDDLPPDVPQIIPLPSSTPRLVIADAPAAGPLLHDQALHRPVLRDPVLKHPALHGPVPHDPAAHDPVPPGPGMHEPGLHLAGPHGPVAAKVADAPEAGRLAPVPANARPPLSAPARKRPAAAWAAIGLGMAACVALGVAIGRQFQTETAPPTITTINTPAARGGDARSAEALSAPEAALPMQQPDPAPAHAPDATPAPPRPGMAQPTLFQPRTVSALPPAPDQAAALPGEPAKAAPTPPRRRPDAPPRQSETRPRDAAAPPHVQQVLRQPPQDARDRADARFGHSFGAPQPPRPDLSGPGWEPSRERRPILGTYTAGPDGMRTFQSIP